MTEVIRAFIDESGQRAFTQRSSDHFILGCVAMPESRLPEAGAWLIDRRRDLGRRESDELHWKNYSAHHFRLRVSQALGTQGFGRILSVVSCKRHLEQPAGFTQDHAYMLSFRYLLERLSWLGRQKQMPVHYTLAHVRGFAVKDLRAYEGKLRELNTQIDWNWISREPSAMDRPTRVEHLQIADMVASAVGAAFNVDKFGNTEPRYLRSFAGRLYRGYQDQKDVLSYGLKLHPGQEAVRAAYPWLATL